MKLLCATTAALLVTVSAAATKVHYAPYLLFSAVHNNDQHASSCTAEELTMVMDTLQSAIPGGLAKQALVDNVQFCSSFVQGSYCEAPPEATKPETRLQSVVSRGLAMINPYCMFGGVGMSKCTVKKFNAVAAPPAPPLPPAAMPAAAVNATNATAPLAGNRTGSGRRQLPVTFESLCRLGGTGKCSVKKFSAVDASLPTPLNDTRTTPATVNATSTPNNNRTLQDAEPAASSTPTPLHRALFGSGMGNLCKWAGIGCPNPNEIKPANTTNRRLVDSDDHQHCHAEFAALEAILVELVPEVSSSCQALLQAAPRVQQCVVV
jgi:hypothetical protein